MTLQSAVDAHDAADWPSCLNELLAAWRLHRHPEIAEAIDRIDQHFRSRMPTERSVAARRASWMKTAARRDPTDLRALLTAVPDTTWKTSLEQVSHLMAFGLDPRVTATLAGVIAQRPWPTRASETYYDEILLHLRRARDVRARDVLPTVDGEWGLQLNIRQTIEALDLEVPPLTKADQALLDRIVVPESDLAARAERLQAQVYETPADLGLRAILADTLVQLGDPRGDFINLQLRGTKKSLSAASKLLDPSWVPHPIRSTTVPASLGFANGFVNEVELRNEDHEAFADRCWATVERLIFKVPGWNAPAWNPDRLLSYPWVRNAREAHLPVPLPPQPSPLGWEVVSTLDMTPALLEYCPSLRWIRILDCSRAKLDHLFSLPGSERIEALTWCRAVYGPERLDDQALAALPNTVQHVVVEPHDTHPFRPSKKSDTFDRVAGGWRLTPGTQGWYSGPTADIVALDLSGLTKVTKWTADLRSTRQGFVNQFPRLPEQSWPWSEVQEEVLGPIDVRIELVFDQHVAPGDVLPWLATKPFGYGYDTLHVNSSKPRSLRKDAVGHVDQFLQKSTHRSLTVSADGRQYRRSFRWSTRHPYTLSTDATQTDRERLLLKLDELAGCVPGLRFAEQKIRSGPRPSIWAHFCNDVRFTGSFTYFGRSTLPWFDAARLLALADLVGVQTRQLANGVVIETTNSLQTPPPAERQTAVVHAVNELFHAAWVERHGYDPQQQLPAALPDFDWTWPTPFLGEGTLGSVRVRARWDDLLDTPSVSIQTSGPRYKTPRWASGPADTAASLSERVPTIRQLVEQVR